VVFTDDRLTRSHALQRLPLERKHERCVRWVDLSKPVDFLRFDFVIGAGIVWYILAPGSHAAAVTE
jgi:hypothetical protein